MKRILTIATLAITGGVGSRHKGEASGNNYELPNMEAYCETCSSPGSDLYRYDTRERKVDVSINGRRIKDYEIRNGYAVIRKVWRKGDVVSIAIPMTARVVRSNDKIVRWLWKEAL